MALRDVFGRSAPEPSRPLPSAPYSTQRAIMGAGQRIDIKNKSEIEQIAKRRVADVWQTDAWEYYDLIGEVKYAFSLVGWVMERIRLYPAYVVDEDSTPVHITNAIGVSDIEKADAKRAFSSLQTVHGGVPGLMRDISLNIGVAGECYLVQQPAQIGSGLPERWSIRSVDEIVSSNGKIAIKPRRNATQAEYEVLGDTAFIGRIWRRHPRYTDEPDSSMKALLGECDELLLLSRALRATARSRLNAGLLFVPDELSIAADVPTGPEDDPNVDILPDVADDDAFESELIDSMMTPISDESSAAAVVPLVVRGPADAGNKIKLIKFERSFDPALNAEKQNALERILQGIDLPKDIVTGLASVKYSNAVHIEDTFYKSHIEPLVLLICDALTTVYYGARMKSYGYDEEESRKHVIWYDASSIVTAPDKSASADIGIANYTLSAEAWRRVHGFAESDAPSAMEQAQRVALTRGPISDAYAEGLWRSLTPDLLNTIRAQQQADSPAPVPTDVSNLIGGDTSTPETPPETPSNAPTDLGPGVTPVVEGQ